MKSNRKSMAFNDTPMENQWAINRTSMEINANALQYQWNIKIKNTESSKLKVYYVSLSCENKQKQTGHK